VRRAIAPRSRGRRVRRRAAKKKRNGKRAKTRKRYTTTTTTTTKTKHQHYQQGKEDGSESEEMKEDDDDDIEEVEERVEEQLLQCLYCLYNVQLCDARKLDSHPGRGGLFSPETPAQAAALLRAIHPFIRRPARLPAALKASAFDALQQVLHHFPLPPASLCTYKPNPTCSPTCNPTQLAHGLQTRTGSGG
jgi:hypothetical protein